MTRALAWAVVIALAIAGVVAGITQFSRPYERGVVGASQVDSSRVGEVRDSARRMDSVSRHQLDSLRDAFAHRPIRDVVHTLPGTTVLVPGPVESVMVAAPVIRETADSLATCHHDRDSLGGDVETWKARDAAHAEALELCRARPHVVGDTDPPSRVTWAAIGGGAALVGVAALLILTN